METSTSIAPDAKSIDQREKLAQLIWTTVIVGFFAIQFVIWAVAIWLTSSDPSHSVVPGYEERSANWDEEQNRRRQSDALGWSADWTIDESRDVFGFAKIRLKFTDAHGDAIDGLQIRARAFHLARASQPAMLTFEHVESGIYVASLQINKSGIWQFVGSAERDADTYLFEKRITIQRRVGP